MIKAIGIQIFKAILGLSLSIKESNKIPIYATLNIILRFFIFRENERKRRKRKNSAENWENEKVYIGCGICGGLERELRNGEDGFGV